MDKRQLIQVSGENRSGISVQTFLPAQPYELLDFMDRLGVEKSPPVVCQPVQARLRRRFCGARRVARNDFREFISRKSIEFKGDPTKSKILWGKCGPQRVVFQGLVKTEARRKTPLSVSRLAELARDAARRQSAEREAKIVVPERIGQKKRRNAAGAAAVPARPGYAILLEISKGNFDDAHCAGGAVVRLELPAAPEVLCAALTQANARGWREVDWHCLDCRAPQLKGAVSEETDIHQINQLAGKLKELTHEQLISYKSVLEAVECGDVQTALALADQLEDYILDPNTHTPEQLARGDLTFTMAEETAEELLPYLDLDGYGKSLLKHYGSAFSDYGLLQRRDCTPVWIFRASNRGAQEIIE